MLRQDTWQEWEKCVLEIFCIALKELTTKPKMPKKEDDITRLLAPIVRRCRRNWIIKNRKELQGHPICRAKGQADEEDKTKQKKEDKDPEFLWGFTDYLKNCDRFFTVECKNLTHPPSGSCSYYVSGGIERYIKKEWSYGIHCSSGLMIAYVQTIGLQAALDGINEYARRKDIPILNLIGEWQKGNISTLKNEFKRPEVPISPFSLHHFWVDLRKFYLSTG